MVGSSISKSKVLSALIWKLMERGGTQGIQFLVQIVLARLLFPEDYGVIALVTVFITLADVFVHSGFGAALIQKKEADEIDFSSVLYLSLFVAGLLYVVLYLSAPTIAGFYQEPQLVLVLRVLSLKLFIGAFHSIQNAYVAKHMMFKKFFFSSLGAIILSGVAGVITAYLGWGVWALVIQQLVNRLSVTLILWVTVRWRPHLLFSWQRMKVLFGYSWKLLLSSLLIIFYRDLRTMIIGKVYSPDLLGIYNRGQAFPSLLARNLDGSIQSVMLPVLASEQENRKRVKEMMRRAIVTSSFIMFPLMIGLAVVAETTVKVLLTERWLPAVPFMQIFCMSEALMPIHTANLQAIKALGRSDIFLKLEIIKTVIALIILGISIPFGIYAMAWGVLLTGIIATFVNIYPNIRLLDYSILEQWKDILPSLGLALLMGAIVYPIGFLSIADLPVLIIQIIIGGIVYIGLAGLFKFDSLQYLLVTMKELIARRNG